ncbi:hypothetical protein PAEVO_51780 [Paenibacillus sp. GM2FR]|uniref:glycosyl hydrolase family 28-related protein n=1 Tax=Paenibacillus sp. GM2FR TaxID=2059268 RepID=UPI000C27E2A9|nr:glycosyl hydrolase family 28-related protein [Paenibacillus sp. GM2FR]PJN50134.1 hypothetical protein PAEVO_51780 [Paenibacillus sp. GM2FR]
MANIEIIRGADNGNPPDTLRQMYPKINRNFNKINNELSNTNSELDAHKKSTAAHKAENITYAGLVPGDDVKEAIDNVNERISEIVAQSGDDITELVDARGGYSVLSARLNASDTRLEGKANKRWFDVLDYGAVGDGVTFSAASIQLALDAAELNGGGVVFVPSGVYLINEILRIGSNTTLLSTANSIFKRSAEITAIILNKSDGTIGGYNANKNVVISGGVFDGSKDEYTTAASSIAFGHCTNILIENVKCINTQIYHSIEINAVKNGVVRNCVFDNYSAGGTEYIQIDLALEAPFPWFGPYDSTMCYNITIEGCLFQNGIDGIGSHSSQTNLTHNNISILRNTFKSMSGICIKPLNYRDVAISNNQVEDCFRGIEIQPADGAGPGNYTITNNVMTNMRYSLDQSRGILVNAGNTHGIISGNIVRGTGRHGIGTDGCSNFTVSNNIIEGCGGNGLWVYNSDDCIVEGNRCYNNFSKVGTGDICIGEAVTFVCDRILATNNYCGRMAISYTDKLMMTNNFINTLSNSSNTNLQNKNNYINGVWTP